MRGLLGNLHPARLQQGPQTGADKFLVIREHDADHNASGIGIAAVRKDPTLAFPSMLIIPTVLGHNSLGMVSLIVARGVSAIQLWQAHDHAPAITAFPQLKYPDSRDG